MQAARGHFIALGLAALVCSWPAAGQNRTIVVASAASMQDSGLFDFILPMFKARTGIEVRLIVQGTSQALDTGRQGGADVVFVHAKTQEEKFVAEGHGVKRFPVMYNDLVLVGPTTDPAGVKGLDIIDALRAIRDKAATFVSHSDRSGTNSPEFDLWQSAGINITRETGSWYKAVGQGTVGALNAASAMNGYTLADRPTWALYRNKDKLTVLLEGDKRLFNQYGVILVNPDKHPNVNSLGQAFIDWLISLDGQNAISSYKVDGRQLYYPDANDPGA
jgi:tungstate transport system substrate-binding protein